MVQYLADIKDALWSVAKGMRVTIRHIYKKPLTLQYPDERQVMLRSVRFADLGRIDVFGHPPPMRVGIGADGVWHYFWSADWLK